MGKDNLENFIRSHREEFDLLEPSQKVWENIAGFRKKKRFVLVNPVIYKVAAVVAIATITAGIAWKIGAFRAGNPTAKIDPEISELIEAEAYYAQQVNGKMDEIRKCYNLYPDIKSEIESDLNELESMYRGLKNDLNDNLSNKIVIEAMIENSRNRLKLVDDILEKIEC